MPDNKYNVPWPGPEEIDTHSVQPLDQGGLTEVPNPAVASSWQGQMEQNFGDNGPFINYKVGYWSTQRTDDPLGGKLGLTLPGDSEISCQNYAYGGDLTPIEALTAHEGGHEVWFWSGYGAHTIITDSMLAVAATLLGCSNATQAVQAEVFAEAFKVLFGPVSGLAYGFAGQYPDPRNIPGARNFLQKSKYILDWLNAHSLDVGTLFYRGDVNQGLWEWETRGVWYCSYDGGKVWFWNGTQWV